MISWQTRTKGWGRQGQMVHPLFTASRSGHLDVVRFLCEARADKFTAMEGGTPLIAASRSGHLDVVRFLCDAGADKDKEEDSKTPLIAASWRGHLEVVRF